MQQHAPALSTSPHRKIRWRIIWLGLALIPFNNYWVFASLRWDQGFPTTMSLFFNAIFALVVLIAVNTLLHKFAPRAALTRGELLTLYTMLSIASAICGHDLFEVIITNIATVGWLATEENEWATLFHRYLPDWLALTDKNKLTVLLYRRIYALSTSAPPVMVATCAGMERIYHCSAFHNVLYQCYSAAAVD